MYMAKSKLRLNIFCCLISTVKWLNGRWVIRTNAFAGQSGQMSGHLVCERKWRKIGLYVALHSRLCIAFYVLYSIAWIKNVFVIENNALFESNTIFILLISMLPLLTLLLVEHLQLLCLYAASLTSHKNFHPP